MVNTNSNIYENRQLILAERSAVLYKNSKAFKGNSRERSTYLNFIEKLKPSLTPFQMSYLVGLILSDASIDTNHSAKTSRLKIQQLSTRKEWLAYIRKIFLEYSGNDEPFTEIKRNNSTMSEYQTLKCTTIYNAVVDLFYTTKRKSIKPALEEWINPVTLAAWVCGDGGTSGNSIQLHSEGFTRDENQLLVEMLERRLGLKSRVTVHSTRHHSRISIAASSFDDFTLLVGPYIHKNFYYRIPIGRVEGSRFGSMTIEKRNALVGSKHEDLDFLIYNVEP